MVMVWHHMAIFKCIVFARKKRHIVFITDRGDLFSDRIFALSHKQRLSRIMWGNIYGDGALYIKSRD